jgi:hypothetical protein
MNLFEIATRKALRFPSLKGELSVEQLWSLPLTSKVGFDLDSIAKGINKDLKDTEEESFVATNTNPRRGDLQVKLDILKHIINVKQEEAAAATKRQANAVERHKLQELLARKNDQELENLTPEQIQAKLDALDA